MSISIIHVLLSRGNRVTNVESSSTRFGVAERGATPAKSLSNARMILRPCVRTKISFVSFKSPFVAVLPTRDERKEHAETSEYRSCNESAPVAHCTSALKSSGGR